MADAHHRLALVWADGGYTGPLVEYCPYCLDDPSPHPITFGASVKRPG